MVSGTIPKIKKLTTEDDSLVNERGESFLLSISIQAEYQLGNMANI
jgi:hypothetical protein